MRIDTCVVESIGEYMDCIAGIASAEGGKDDAGKPPILWFRGQTDCNYTLSPSLFRSGTRVERENSDMDYSSLHYAEDIRTQHYIAKNFQFFRIEPSSRVEWLEVMQHHEMGTRVLDWSESSIHSLIFAVEPFLDNKRFHSPEREICVPCVWVLEPGNLNKKIFEYVAEEILNEGHIVKRLIEEFDLEEEKEMRYFGI